MRNPGIRTQDQQAEWRQASQVVVHTDGSPLASQRYFEDSVTGHEPQIDIRTPAQVAAQFARAS
jgi:hypothetical protein